MADIAAALTADPSPTDMPLSPGMALLLGGVVLPTMVVGAFQEPSAPDLAIGVARYLYELEAGAPIADWLCEPRLASGLGLEPTPWTDAERSLVLQTAQEKLDRALERITHHLGKSVEMAMISLTDPHAPGHADAYHAFAFGMSLNARAILEGASGTTPEVSPGWLGGG